MSGQKIQQDKEKAVLLGLGQNVALIRRGLSVYGMNKDGTATILSTSKIHDHLWADALKALKKQKPKNKSLDTELAVKVDKYESLTKKALAEIKVKPVLSEKEKRVAADFLSMAQNYFADAQFYKEKKELLVALAAFSYAHAWLDAGVRAHLFDATDDQLFTLP